MTARANSLRTAGNGLVLIGLLLLAAWFASLHARPWLTVAPTSAQSCSAAALVAAYLLACAIPWWRARVTSTSSPTALGSDAWLVAYASQTGFAEQIALRTAQSLRDAGQAVELRALGTLDAASLEGRRCLFVASTTGEGDPPDHALGFVRDVMGATRKLDGLRYAVLAVGDSEYRHFCAFGHQLDAWLKAAGAQPLFDLVEVDNADPSALRHWQHHLGVAAAAPELPDWTAAAYQPWRLIERRLLNAGSAGGAVHLLRLQPTQGALPDWQAGDIAEIGPRNAPALVSEMLRALDLPADASVRWSGGTSILADVLARAHLPDSADLAGLSPQAVCDRLQPLPHREYSIASIPTAGSLDLVVRVMQRADGSPGLGSGWLCMHADVGQPIDLRIRDNRNFHPPDSTRRMILIGNGTGIAGLRAHLQARDVSDGPRNWLLFGERNAAFDDLFGDEIAAWHDTGLFERLDRVWSRDGGEHRYVQDALRANAAELRKWIEQGTCIHVCGSLQGMAPGVDAVLREALGNAQVDALLAEGRYRRDVY